MARTGVIVESESAPCKKAAGEVRLPAFQTGGLQGSRSKDWLRGYLFKVNVPSNKFHEPVPFQE